MADHHMQETPTNPAVFKPFLLLGLLANYNKFEFRNPYRLRLGDFVNESAIQKVVYGFGSTCSLARDRYVAVQDDVDQGWTLATTLSYIGLGALAPSRTQTTSINDDHPRKAKKPQSPPSSPTHPTSYTTRTAHPAAHSTPNSPSRPCGSFSKTTASRSISRPLNLPSPSASAAKSRPSSPQTPNPALQSK
ncbi:MAG: hypothetical protein Q9191_008066 [Dirinaria sp. TL-2023a]